MTIEQLDESKVLISLCNEDMRDYKLKFSEMSFCSEHSKRILMRLLRLACLKAGVNFEHKTWLLEALPHSSGCLLLVTMLEKKHRKTYKVKRLTEQGCFVFDNAENLLSAAEILRVKDVFLRSNSLWLLKGKYYLVFDYSVVSALVNNIFQEYSKYFRYSQVAISRIKEIGKPLCTGNALGEIGQKIRG